MPMERQWHYFVMESFEGASFAMDGFAVEGLEMAALTFRASLAPSSKTLAVCCVADLISQR